MRETIYIKNMVCPRCVRVVREDLEKMGLEVHHVELGEAEVETFVEEFPFEAVKTVLEASGFELLDNQERVAIEAIKHVIIGWVEAETKSEVPLSQIIEKEVGKSYSYLSKLFSRTEGITIEKYFILQKIEKAKELLLYDEFSASQIAVQLHYSSTAHFSRQFKEVTGHTIREFKQEHTSHRKGIDRV